VARVTRTVEKIHTSIASRKLVGEYEKSTTHCQRTCLEFGQSTPATVQDGKLFAFITDLRMKCTTYYLSMGKVVVQYGLRCDEDENEYEIVGSWKYHPPRWLYAKGFATRVVLRARYGAEPTIALSLSTHAVLPDDHPVWIAIYKADFMRFQAIFRAGEFGVNDTDSSGYSLLHVVCSC